MRLNSSSLITGEFSESLPRELVTHVNAICGHDGAVWLERLPQTIREMEKLWSISVLEPFPGIEFNFVAPATALDGSRCVIKIAPPYKNSEIFSEARYLKSRNGNGAVKLLAAERVRRAILIEHAFPGHALFQYFKNDPPACVGPAIGVLQALLQQPPDDRADIQILDEWFENFRRFRHTDFPRRHAEKAIEIYERLSKEAGRTFYLHGDFHPGNIVTSEREPYLAIDPKGLIGHIGYDIAVFLNNLHWWQKNNMGAEKLLSHAIAKFVQAFDLSECEIRQWAYASMVIGAWWSFDEMPELYNDEVAMADVWGI